MRAQRTSDDFLGSAAFALEIAPAATNAGKSSPSIVFSLSLLRIAINHLDPFGGQEADAIVQLHAMVPCAGISHQNRNLLLGASILRGDLLLREMSRVDRSLEFFSSLKLSSFRFLLLFIPFSFI